MIELPGGGVDRIECALSIALPENVENLLMTGIAAINGTGNLLANTLTGNVGANALRGGGGNDHLFGQAGKDRLDGGSGNDRIYGGTGNDRIDGGIGNDVLQGGPGTDALRGGSGRDVFRFVETDESDVGAARDRIVDFIPGLDRLDIRALDVGPTDVSYVDGILSIDSDRDGEADFEIAFTNSADLEMADFVF